ncbi:MAG: YdeI/OmpD-associated family protein [Bacteroidales bacterium]
MKSLAEKLFLKPGFNVLMKGAGMDDFPDLQLFSISNSEGPADFILIWAENSQQIESLFEEVKLPLKPETVFWIAYPKKGSGKNSDLHRDQGWHTLKSAGWRPVSQVSMNDVWTALRFKPDAWPEPTPSKIRSELVVPIEMQHLLEKEGLWDVFQALSYTHRKEYIEAFEVAKKPETRQRRLTLMVEKLKARKK